MYAEQANWIVLIFGNKEQLLYSPLQQKSNLSIAISVSLSKKCFLLTLLIANYFSFSLFLYLLFSSEMSLERKQEALNQLTLQFWRTLWNKVILFTVRFRRTNAVSLLKLQWLVKTELNLNKSIVKSIMNGKSRSHDFFFLEWKNLELTLCCLPLGNGYSFHNQVFLYFLFSFFLSTSSGRHQSKMKEERFMKTENAKPFLTKWSPGESPSCWNHWEIIFSCAVGLPQPALDKIWKSLQTEVGPVA